MVVIAIPARAVRTTRNKRVSRQVLRACYEVEGALIHSTYSDDESWRALPSECASTLRAIELFATSEMRT
jgi:hypothetical protein